MEVSTAVIFASGYGSRMLPVTAAVQKELLPILDRPVIDYVVADCIAAGIQHIMFIIRPGSRALQDYYLGNATLERHLQHFGKHAALEQLAALHRQAKFSFVEQPDDAGYGSAVPLLVAAPHLPAREAFVACGGDDFLWRTDGGSDLADLIAAFQHASATGGLLAIERADHELSRYGVLSVSEQAGQAYLRGIVEKPAAGQAPSNLINVSKYVLTPDILEYARQVKPNPASGELYIVDAIQAAAAEHPVVVQPARGQFLDSGTLASWLEANLVVAQSRPGLAPISHGL